MSAIAPIRRQVVVPVSSERAFTAWTEQLHAWWPFGRHSVYGEEATAAFVDGELIETAPDLVSVPFFPHLRDSKPSKPTC